MFTIIKKTLNWGGRPLTIETGKVARQADGAVIVTYGETQVLATACAKKTPMAGIDFLPLTVAYTEKFYAAGKIPGGYLKRESRPSDKETLTSRLIDRPIRPLFPSYYTNDTQVLLTVLSHDMENDPDVVAIIAASAALAISGIPLLTPVGGSRVGYVDGAFVLNPTLSQRTAFALDLVVAGTAEGVLMVESEAHELSEQVMLDAVMFGHAGYQPVIDLISELVRDAGKPKWDVPTPDASYEALKIQIKGLIAHDLEAAFALRDKQPRQQALLGAKEKMLASLGTEASDITLVYGEKIFKDLEKDIVRGAILDKRPRLDGRTMDTVRSIVAEVGGVPRAHGSALFTRGETQALVVTTLGTGDDEQMVDGLEGTMKERFMLHYNFPPYSVGEVSPLRAPGRREIGHGKLAWRAINPLLPSVDACPYTLRIVSEITESNGSSSMATVCGASLSLMDAGIPLAAPVAGIAMGLIKEDQRFVVLSDILGDEDHLGDMDFKVAGTEKGITALQMDIKITSITKDIMAIALEQAQRGRLHILGEMAKAITEARSHVSIHAPQMQTLQIPKDKIREVIGTGGKVIREITAVSGAKIDIAEDGTIQIFSPNGESIETALSMIRDIVAVPEIGHLYTGPVVGIKEFGAFVRFLGSLDGLVHISEISDERIASVEEKLKVGDIVTVKLLSVDERGKYKLSIKQAK